MSVITRMISSSVIKPVLEELKAYIQDIYGSKIIQFILFGSYARDEARTDSDVDVLVLVEDNVNVFEVRQQMSEFLLDVLLTKQLVISVLVVPESLYNGYKSPLFLNIKEEGIIV